MFICLGIHLYYKMREVTLQHCIVDQGLDSSLVFIKQSAKQTQSQKRMSYEYEMSLHTTYEISEITLKTRNN